MSTPRSLTPLFPLKRGLNIQLGAISGTGLALWSKGLTFFGNPVSFTYCFVFTQRQIRQIYIGVYLAHYRWRRLTFIKVLIPVFSSLSHTLTTPPNPSYPNTHKKLTHLLLFVNDAIEKKNGIDRNHYQQVTKIQNLNRPKICNRCTSNYKILSNTAAGQLFLPHIQESIFIISD